MKSVENKFPRKGEIWVADYTFKFSDLHLQEQGFTAESQIKKNRPCIIISNDTYNEFSEWIFAVPLVSEDTSEIKRSLEVLVNADQLNKLSSNSKALIRFTSYLSKEFRLKKLVGSVKEEVMDEIAGKLTTFC